MFETCDHRNCAVVKLLIMIKIVSWEHERLKMSEDDILTVGMRALVALSVTENEVLDATIDMLLSPLMRDVEDDPAMTTRNGEDPER